MQKIHQFALHHVASILNLSNEIKWIEGVTHSSLGILFKSIFYWDTHVPIYTKNVIANKAHPHNTLKFLENRESIMIDWIRG